MSTIPAIYEDGVFRPLEPVDIPMGTRASVILVAPDADKSWMQLCGTLSDDEAKDMLAAIEEAFEQVEEP